MTRRADQDAATEYCWIKFGAALVILFTASPMISMLRTTAS
jgi:hypothetical protein